MRIKRALPAVLTATVLLITGAAATGAATAATSTTAAPASATSATAASSATTAQAGITLAKAIKIAKKKVPGGRVTEVEREFEHGHRTWKIELRKGGLEYEVYVSIKTGKIIKFKIDD